MTDVGSVSRSSEPTTSTNQQPARAVWRQICKYANTQIWRHQHAGVKSIILLASRRANSWRPAGPRGASGRAPDALGGAGGPRCCVGATNETKFAVQSGARSYSGAGRVPTARMCRPVAHGRNPVHARAQSCASLARKAVQQHTSARRGASHDDEWPRAHATLKCVA